MIGPNDNHGCSTHWLTEPPDYLYTALPAVQSQSEHSCLVVFPAAFVCRSHLASPAMIPKGREHVALLTGPAEREDVAESDRSSIRPSRQVNGPGAAKLSRGRSHCDTAGSVQARRTVEELWGIPLKPSLQVMPATSISPGGPSKRTSDLRLAGGRLTRYRFDECCWMRIGFVSHSSEPQ